MGVKTPQEISRGYLGTSFLSANAYYLKGMYAGEVGVPRLLKLFAKYDMKTTWFIPGG